MSKHLRHASFFSGVGGLDLGFERAGIETVSVCEIDPYASSVLAERFPSAPNLGSITEVEADDIPQAEIWSGGFPCQDLSIAGKRRGFEGKRSSLAFTFLNLVEQRRPRWIVLENVPGLFSSNSGLDFLRLLSEMGEIGYSVAWRTFDARFFGVAQRRRRVFIVASLEPDLAGEVLFECEGGCGHLASCEPTGENTSRIPDLGANVPSSELAGSLTARFWKGPNSTLDEPLIIRSSVDASGVREADGLAGRLDDQQGLVGSDSVQENNGWRVGVRNIEVAGMTTNFGEYRKVETDAASLRASGGDAGGGSENLAVVAYQTRADEKAGNFTINEVDVANSLSALWPGDTSHRSMTLVAPRSDDEIISFPSRYSMQPTKFNDQTDPLTLAAGAPAVFRKSRRAQSTEDAETWVEGDVANTINLFDSGDVRTTHAVIGSSYDGMNQKLDPDGPHRTLRVGRDSSDFVVSAAGIEDDPLLPLGLDSHRYRCCGNGVVANVAEWIGVRIAAVDAKFIKE